MKTAIETVNSSYYFVFNRFLNLLLFDQFDLPTLDQGKYPLTDFPRMYNLIMCDDVMISPNAGIQHFTNSVNTFFMDSDPEDRTNLFNCYMRSNARSIVNTIIDNQKSSYLGLSKYELADFTDEDLEFGTVVRSESTPQILSFLFNHFADFYFEVKIDGKNISVDNYQYLLKKYSTEIEAEKIVENSESPLFSELPEPLTEITDDFLEDYQLGKYIPIKQRKKKK